MQDQQRLDTMEARYRTIEEQYAEDFNLARNQALTNLQRLAVHAIHAYAQKHHYTLVLGNDLYFVAPTLNITAAVLAHLQALYQARSQSTPHAR
jgi:Outer membrane protein (OmpH-like).